MPRLPLGILLLFLVAGLVCCVTAKLHDDNDNADAAPSSDEPIVDKAESGDFPSVSRKATDEEDAPMPTGTNFSDSQFVLTVSQDNFTSTVAKASLAIVFTYSPSCPKCQVAIPYFDFLANSFHNKTLHEDLDDDKFEESGEKNKQEDGGNKKNASADADSVAAQVFLSKYRQWTFLAINVDENPIFGERFQISQLPTLSVFVAGMEAKFEETPVTLDNLPQTLLRIRRAFSTEVTHDIATTVERLVRQRNKTLVIIRDHLAPTTGVFESGSVSALELKERETRTAAESSTCMVAMFHAAALLVNVDWLHITYAATEKVYRDAQDLIKVDLKLPQFEKDFKESAQCSGTTGMVILKPWGGKTTSAKDLANVQLAGVSLPVPVSPSLVIDSLATHALPLLGVYGGSSERLYDRAHMSRRDNIPKPPHIRHLEQQFVHPKNPREDLRLMPRVRPVLVMLMQTQSCAADSKNVKYIQRLLRSIAVDFPQISVAVANEYRYAPLLLRLGFKKFHARAYAAIGILADGHKYSFLRWWRQYYQAVEEQEEKKGAEQDARLFNATLVRQFVESFVNGDEPYFIRTSEESKKIHQHHQQRALQVTGKTFENFLFRHEEVPPPGAVGGIDDVILVSLTNPYCNHCETIDNNIEELHRMAVKAQKDEQNEKELVEERRRSRGEIDPFAHMLDIDAFLDPGDIPSDLERLRFEEADGAVFGGDPNGMVPSYPERQEEDEKRNNDAEEQEEEASGNTVSQRAAKTKTEFEDDDEEEGIVDASLSTPNSKNVTVEVLRKLKVIRINGQENDLPSEYFMPSLRLNSMPVVFAIRRRSLVSYYQRLKQKKHPSHEPRESAIENDNHPGAAGEGTASHEDLEAVWEVSVGGPKFFHFARPIWSEKPPTAAELLQIAVASWTHKTSTLAIPDHWFV